MNANDLLNINDLKIKSIYVAKWSKDILIQELGLLAIMEMYQSMNIKDIGKGKIEIKPLDIARIVTMSVIDESGNLVFSEEHVPALAKKNRDALMFIYSEIMALSGSEDEAVKN